MKIFLRRIRWRFVALLIDAVILLPVFSQIYEQGYIDGYDDGADDTPPWDNNPVPWLDRFKALKYHFKGV